MTVASLLRRLDGRIVSADGSAPADGSISMRARSRILLASLCLLALVTSVPTAARNGEWWRPVVALAIAAAGTQLYMRTAGRNRG